MKDAFRFLTRAPRFALSCALVVALGVTLSTILFAVIDATLVEPWPYAGADRIVTIRANYPEQGRERFDLWSAPEVADLERQTDVFDAVIAGVAPPTTVDAGGGPERVRAAALTPNAFDMLGVAAHLGRTLRDEDAAPGAARVAVVSHAFWKQRLGSDPAVVGRRVRMNGTPVEIVGVMPPRFVWWDRDVWLPLRIDPFAPRNDRQFTVQGRLRSGLSMSEAERRLTAFAAALRAAHPEREEYRHLSVSLRTLLDDVLRELRPALTMLLVAVVLVMAVAAANLSSVVLGRAVAREGEFAVRYALGASTRRILAQIVAENAAIAAAGAVLGVAGAVLLLGPVLRLVPYSFIPAEAHVAIDWRTAGLSLGLSVLLATLAAVVPGLRVASRPLSIALRRGDMRTGTRHVSRIRYTFVAAQIAVAVMLTGASAAAATVLLRSIARDPGFDVSNVWTSRVSDGNPLAIQRLLERMAGERTGVAAVSVLPVGSLPTALASVPAQPGVQGTDEREIDYMTASPGAARTLGFRLNEGRGFRQTDDVSSAAVCIVTDTVARRLWPDGALSRQLTIRIDASAATAVTATVVGVIADVDTRGDGRPRPLVLLPLAQAPAQGSVTIVGRGPAADGLAGLRRALRTTLPDAAAYEARTLADARRDVLGPRIFAVVLLGMFCAAVLVLSVVGLHALFVELARDRQKETAIRLALGALPRDLFLSELRRGGTLLACAAAATAPAWLALPKLMAPVFQDTQAIVWPAAGSSALVIAAVCIAAIAAPSWRASRAVNLPASVR